MALTTGTKLVNQSGHPVVLGKLLGRGGEGSVFEIGTDSRMAAKVYHKTLTPDKASKVSAMVQLQSDRLLHLAAWPAQLLHERHGRRVVGVLMPRIVNFEPIHTLYSPKSRIAEFPDADWRFLVHSAANIARAFSVIHEHGHVIGDVNHGNVLVSRQAIAKLIDCDSFQVTAAGRQYLCEVGVSTHTPPELQRRPLSTVVRTSNHDAFGLAVLIFQLVFLGRHPFSGAFQGPGAMPIERAIQEHRFSYSSRAAASQMRRPPATLSLNALPRSVVELFERAFAPTGVQSGGRPTAQQWVAVLSQLSADIRQCPRNNSHYFPRGVVSCPWCEIEIQSGAVLFNFVLTGTFVKDRFNITAFWSQVIGVQAPGPLPSLPDRASLGMVPSAQAVEIGKRHRRWWFRAAGAVILVVVVSLILGSAGLAVLMFFGAAVVGGVTVGTKTGPARQKTDQAVREAHTRFCPLAKDWQTTDLEEKFQGVLRSLSASKVAYEQLAGKRNERLRQLEQTRRLNQLRKFLDSHRIEKARITGIGPSRIATLESYGIETAADVRQATILLIPGFGPELAARLVNWRGTVERRFAFDPRKGVDPVDVASIERDIAQERADRQREFRSGMAKLQQISQQVLTRREHLRGPLEQAARELAQAEADHDAVAHYITNTYG